MIYIDFRLRKRRVKKTDEERKKEAKEKWEKMLKTNNFISNIELLKSCYKKGYNVKRLISFLEKNKINANCFYYHIKSNFTQLEYHFFEKIKQNNKKELNYKTSAYDNYCKIFDGNNLLKEKIFKKWGVYEL